MPKFSCLFRVFAVFRSYLSKKAYPATIIGRDDSMSKNKIVKTIATILVVVLVVFVALVYFEISVMGDPFEIQAWMVEHLTIDPNASPDGTTPDGETTVTPTPGKYKDPEMLSDELVAQILNNNGNRKIYTEYAKAYADADRPIKEILIEGESAKIVSGDKVSVVNNYNGAAAALKWQDEGEVEYTFNVDKAGLYLIRMKYSSFPVEGKTTSGNIELKFKLNGEMPFDCAAELVFTKLWADEKVEGANVDDRGFVSDSRGNNIRPTQILVEDWREVDFTDSQAVYTEELMVYFEAGENTITLSGTKTNFAIDWIKVYNTDKTPTYDEYRASISNSGVATGFVKTIEAEVTDLKSISSITPNWDRSGPATSPSHPSALILNLIGGTNWQTVGEWVEWSFDVEQEGDYKIAFRYRQNFISGLFTSRRVYIDGAVPFEELDGVAFHFGNDWQTLELADENGEAYLIHLTPGKHTIRLEVTMGELAQTLQTLEESVYLLNYTYREIIAITTTSPDQYRDYKLENDIDYLADKFFTVSNWLETEALRLAEIIGNKGGEISIMLNAADQLNDFAEDPEEIVERMAAYKDTVTSLSSLMMQLQQQALEIDVISIASADAENTFNKASWGENFVFQVQAFIGSFTTDYSTVGDEAEGGEKTITVWFPGSREQAEIVKRMITDTFTPKYGINVNLELAQIGLAQAIIAGTAPDVLTSTGRADPVNLAARGALYPLSDFEDYEETLAWFNEGAAEPYKYNGDNKYYGIPVTENYHMMFYRTDIFTDLGIEPPETWEEFYKLIPVIQRNNMEIGLPYTSMAAAGINTGLGTRDLYITLLLQQGGQVFKDDLTAVDLDSAIALAAFKEWTEFYKLYSFPLEFDFYNRFRTGEMPIGITGYGTYNLLSAAAPEIRGLWKMAPIPGTLKEDGTIDRTEATSGSAAVIPADTEYPEEAWTFVKWWVSAEAQARYGNELEILMGAASRYDTANLEALEMLPWSTTELEILAEQREHVVTIPEVVGGYYVSRSIDNAFRDVYFNGENTRDAVYEHMIIANSEITRKRAEFGLD